MKKTHLAALFLVFAAISCSDDDDPAPVTPPATSYMNVKAGSTWNYEQINTTPAGPTTTYTLTSTNRDSTIAGNLFHVFTNSSNNASEYYRVSGNDYFTFQSLPAALGGAKVTNLYLKTGATAGTSWPQTYSITVTGFPLPLDVTVTHRIEATGLAKTVNAIAYTNVIHVKSTITVAGVPATALTTDIQSYYAPNAGLIENKNEIHLNYFGLVNDVNVTTTLKTATLL